MKFFGEIINNNNIKKDMGLINMTDEFFCAYVNTIFHSKKSVLIVVDTLFEANKIYSSISNYNENALLFPMDDFLTSEALAISPDLMVKRLETINNIINNDNSIVITNLMGYLRFLPTKENYLDKIIKINVGSTYDPKELASMLTSIGYKRDTLVNKTGEFGVRGFVVDIFPIYEDNPIRIEFFDDEVESIRIFDADSQKSISAIDSVSIYPFSEFLCNKEVKDDHSNKQKYLQLYSNVSNISSYLSNCIVIYKDYEQLKISYNNTLNEVVEYKNNNDSDFDLDYFFDFLSINEKFPVYYCSINNKVNYDYISYIEDFNVKTINGFNEDSNQINDFINSNIHNGKTIVICVKKYQIKSLYKFLNMKVFETTFDNIKIGTVNIIDCNISDGFIYKDITVLSSHELFNINNKNKKYHTRYKYASSISDINKLVVGDYVVHNIHGIGRYNGIKSLTLNDITKDYLEVLYQGTDKIYIPVEKIDLLYKYSGREGAIPKINKLGGTEWQKTKNRVKSKVSDMADKLLKLYAEREMKKGFSFSKDCDLSLDFEKAFPYELTVDQIKAISQIKEDMENSAPMDRLLCGDVGFGKTEVAFVAAFKAILDSKQVLFLCPTTILSNQHYENAIERFKNFPVNIALLNRFTTPKETNRIISGLKDGTIDFVIGTHRLLSDDICLKDLGLLIIDEEQRFGVVHKEKIKQYKTNVDVLTLTATPIPRTLQMSLVGIRSLSLITTPPVNRFPVQTYVIEENKQILKDAIYKELSRNGQVFILYNRVQSIDEYALRIKNLVPDAKVGVAHGQMSKNQLEGTLFDFIKHEYDILICTTIIETGIDIPNVNTLIIIDADRFGLSQLYQIRGRVGRSDKFAYAYLTYQPFKSLTETAIKRLNVIKEFTELGSGFSIATRDLSIRGAGDILGSEQAGFIDSVGIDLYLKMLNDEINNKNEIEILDDDKEDIDSDSKPLLNVATHISDEYVYEDDLKIEIHKKINSIDSLDKLNMIKSELEDRFGKLDEDVIIYMYEEWFEKLAKQVRLRNVHQNKNSIELVFSNDIVSKLDTEELFVDAFQITPMFRFVSKGSNMVIVLDIIKLDKHPVYYLVELLNKIYSNLNDSID